MSVGLFEHARDSRDVLDGEAEENEIHRRLAHHVVLVQRLLHRLRVNVRFILSLMSHYEHLSYYIYMYMYMYTVCTCIDKLYIFIACLHVY